VLVRCPGCSNLHLIADRLGYFGDSDWDIESVLAKTGQQDGFKKFTDDSVFEITLEDFVGKEKMDELLASPNGGEGDEEFSKDETSVPPTTPLSS
jgi:hypothetical protein